MFSVTSSSLTKTLVIPFSNFNLSNSFFVMSITAGVLSTIPFRKAQNVIARYIAPVSKYVNPSFFARFFAAVDLPEPAGPSIAITIFFDIGSQKYQINSGAANLNFISNPKRFLFVRF
jgi:hypothetical protein